MKSKQDIKRRYEKEAQAKLKGLVTEKSPIEFVFAGIDLILAEIEKEGYYVTEFGVNFAKDYEVCLKLVDKKPKGWARSFILDLLARISGGLGHMYLLMYSFKLRYNKPLLVEIGEYPDSKYTSFDLREPEDVQARFSAMSQQQTYNNQEPSDELEWAKDLPKTSSNDKMEALLHG